MQFSELLKSVVPGPGACSLQVPDDWTQGRSLFGGLQVVLAIRAMRTLVPAGVPLRTVQTSFIAPVPPGLVSVQAKVLRTGKSATQIEARIVDGDETLCLVIGIFGQARSSTTERAPAQSVVTSEKPILMPYIAGIIPAFTQHFEARWLKGGLPFTGVDDACAVVEIGMRGEDRASEDHVVAIADFIPPIALSMLKKPSPGSSMTWMLEFVRERFDDLSAQGWRVDAEMQAAQDGYISQSVMIWGPGGEPVALSRQSMVVFG